MHSSVNGFVTELFYENRLNSKEHLDKQQVIAAKYVGAGFYLEEVEHRGNTNPPTKEENKVVEIVERLTRGDVHFINVNNYQER